MKHRNFHRSERGMTLVEVAVASGIGAVVLGLGVTLSNSSMRDSNSMFIRSGLHIRASDATDKIARELQTATMSGEDTNHNGVLDSGEDINRDGRLDADWTLGDGVSAATMTFNKLKNGWQWSGPIQYLVTSDGLVRRENGVDRVICTGVTSLQFQRTGTIVDVSLTLTAKDRQGVTWTENSKRRANVRN